MQLSAFDGGGGLTFTSDIGRRTKIDVAQSFAYQPNYGINFMTGVTAPSGDTTVDAGEQSSQIGLNSMRSYSLDGRVGLTRTLGARCVRASRLQLSIAAVRRQRRDVQLASRKCRVVRGASRDTCGITSGLRLRRRPRTHWRAGAVALVNHNLDLGIDYNRQVSFSRRTHDQLLVRIDGGRRRHGHPATA